MDTVIRLVITLTLDNDLSIGSSSNSLAAGDSIREKSQSLIVCVLMEIKVLRGLRTITIKGYLRY